MNSAFKTIALGSALCAGLFLGACDQKPQASAEAQGERMDNASEELTQGHKDRSDGPMENAGEHIDKVNEEMQKSVDEMNKPGR